MANIAENLRAKSGVPIDDYIDESKEILKLILNDGSIIEFVNLIVILSTVKRRTNASIVLTFCKRDFSYYK